MTARSYYFAAILISLLVHAPVLAQNEGLSHSAYLEAEGMLQDAADVEQWLRDRLAERKPEWSLEKRNQNAAFFAFIFTVSGVTAKMAAALESNGVDIIHGISEDSRPFIEQALLADVVVVGDVVRSEASNQPDDGFAVSDHVQVRRVLKGSIAANSIVIRRREQARARDIAPEVGSRYLLLLSNGMYNFSAARHLASKGIAESSPSDGHFSIYRIYEMDGQRLLWSNFSRDDTGYAFEQIQLLDELLDASSK